MSKSWCLLLGVLLSTVCFSQEKWTLDDCVDKGKENSLRLMVSALQTQVTERQKQSVASYYLPDVTFNGGQSYNFGSAIDPTTNSRVSSNIQSTRASLDAGITLFDYGNFIVHKRDLLNIDYARLDEAEVLFQYQMSILELFYEIIGSQSLLEIQKQQLVNSMANLDRVQKEVEAGAKPKSDFYDIEYIYHSETISIQQTENSLYNQKLKLLHLLNVDNVEATDLSLVQKEESIAQLTAYEFNPTVERNRVKQQLLEQDRKLIKSKNLPRLVGNYQYGSFFSKPFNSDVEVRSNPFSKQMGDNKSQYVSFGLSIPVFQGGNVRRQLRVKNEEIRLNTLKIKESEVNLSNQVKELEQEIVQLDNIAKQLHRSIELSEKSFSTTQAKYENGKVDIFSFNAAKNQLLNSQFALIKNAYNRSFMRDKMRLYNTNSL
ncbi:TolC family protein [Myroides marinus]|uniref:TolC family protein n=1 Tax=Myroides marinus TaxID=703342 RepID=UPI002575FC6A|nr:TolC family protein [Myroides marinus]MDM1367559.1 TolC family protein [Myroides marinus]MDM1371774.1 TolC family protein [Myroides marinus]MDM1374754.1 TolC family protein [Myroides marinus]MDM1382259.1 TolC family protein [Myroides marinus]MDM1389432.1 TolC family protein [Myroides marinus]